MTLKEFTARMCEMYDINAGDFASFDELLDEIYSDSQYDKYVIGYLIGVVDEATIDAAYDEAVMLT